ncbi:patatin-like phospholipase domain-containing protein 4 [Peromyscus leucopus]|uniref:patatin-like phospholipase domain-containing protein 4 n=1 Tax=Peromyscus leucopus TaxID=10041 RepID=UPI0018852893|nr:patatin-like phospholipase domain-containing protein 4 [Peromyscus leucopus]
MAPVRLSFSAAGFLGLYHLGAAHVLRVRGSRLLRQVTGVAGASAGALVAAALVTAPERLELCTRFALDLARTRGGARWGSRPRGSTSWPGEARAAHRRTRACENTHPGSEARRDTPRHTWVLPPLPPGPSRSHQCRAHACDGTHACVDAARGLGGRGFRTRVSSVFSRSPPQVLLASCFVPVFAGLEAVEFEGEAWTDGALSNALPVPPGLGRAVSVSPFCGGAVVSPRDPGLWGWGPRVRMNNLEVAVSAGHVTRVFSHDVRDFRSHTRVTSCPAPQLLVHVLPPITRVFSHVTCDFLSCTRVTSCSYCMTSCDTRDFLSHPPPPSRSPTLP